MKKYLLVILTAVALTANAAYPDRSIKLVVGYPPGGGTDILARYLESRLSDKLKWNIAVENRPGATGMIANEVVAVSRNDGYTLLMGHITPNAVNPGAFQNPPIRVNWNLEPVVLVAEAPSVLVVNSRLPVNTVSDLKNFIKDNNTVFASDGIGSLAHLQMTWFLSNMAALHSPYKGGSPALQSILTEETQYLFSPAPVSIQWIKSGKVKALAQTTNVRSKVLPHLPTMVESGERGFDAPLWWGIFAPVGTPTVILDLWAKEVNKILTEPETVEWMRNLGYEAKIMTRQEFNKYVNNEQIKWKKLTDSISK